MLRHMGLHDKAKTIESAILGVSSSLVLRVQSAEEFDRLTDNR